MNIERLFELAGVNLLLEAVHDDMITKLKNDFPKDSAEIDYILKQVKPILKKEDRIIWYIKILRAYLSDNINTVKGDYKFTNIQKFNNDLFKYYNYNVPTINNTQLHNQNISELFNTFDKYYATFIESDKAPVPTQQGDKEIIKCNDGTSWWFVDRSFCYDEARSGKHCGNTYRGKHDTSQRILSLRTPNHNVILTFILWQDGHLGEMKGKANQKPSDKYHPNIMQLLLNPIVKGIRSGGDEAPNNFSIFDLSDKDINILIQHNKQSFIVDQIKATPVEFLKAPNYIKNDKDYQQIVIDKIPAFKYVVGKDYNDLHSWEQAIDDNPNLIMYAPKSLEDYEDRLINYFGESPEELKIAPAFLSQNYDFLWKLVSSDGILIEHIDSNIQNYDKLCIQAIKNNPYSLGYIPYNKRTVEMCKLAVNADDEVWEYVPSELEHEVTKELNLKESVFKYFQNL